MPMATPRALAKVVEDSRYKFRADFPGVLSEKVEDFAATGGALAWRLYTSRSPDNEKTFSYTATVKVFDTDSAEVRQLLAAGESDASQSIGVALMGRTNCEFGADKLPCMMLQYQSGAANSMGAVTGKVMLVVKGKRLYQVTFYFSGADQAAVGEKFFQSFEILP
jgi:hypothetical protein